MKNKAYYESLSGGILLVGLGVLFLLPGHPFWPWILVVIAAAGLPASLANKKGWLGWQGFFWLAGLAVLFWSGYFWPGILILLGISTLFGALTRESAGSPFASRPPEGEATPFAEQPTEKKEEPSSGDESHPTRKLE
jgi:hypothetical protein